MVRVLPLAFLILCASLFGLAWIVVEVDPDTAVWYLFVLLVFLTFLIVFSFLGLLLYFLRTRFYKRYNSNWYVSTSFKMALFIAAFVTLTAALAILQLVTLFNVILAILAVSLVAVWSYLGKKAKG